jgi:uncharacterized protein
MKLVNRLIGLGVDLSTKKALKSALGMIGISPENIDHLYIELRNEIMKGEFEEIKSKYKLVFLPQCLRKSSKCKAKLGEDGFECVGCSTDCKAGEIKRLGETEGYKVFIVPGGSMVGKLIKKYEPKAVVGVACIKELVMALEEIKAPLRAIELSKDGCVETDVETLKVKEALGIK